MPKKAGAAYEQFIKYASARGDRTMMPVVAVGGTGFLRSMNWRQLPGIVRAIKEMRAYLAGPALTDPPSERDARVRAFFTDAFQVIGSYAESPEIVAIVVDDMTGKVLSELAAESEPAQRPGDHIPDGL